jgi:hypothetical protein
MVGSEVGFKVGSGVPNASTGASVTSVYEQISTCEDTYRGL